MARARKLLLKGLLMPVEPDLPGPKNLAGLYKLVNEANLPKPRRSK